MATADSKPTLTEEDAKALLLEEYGIEVVSLKSLVSYDDQNFLVTAKGSEKYVLKIHMTTELLETLELQTSVINHLANSGMRTPRVHESKKGKLISRYTAAPDRHHYIRLLSFLPGKTLHDVEGQSTEMVVGLGRLLGEVDTALRGLDDERAKTRHLEWDTANALEVVAKHFDAVPEEDRPVLQHYIDTFKAVSKTYEACPKQVIHNDGNDQNVVVNAEGTEIVGLIDYGDVVYTQTVNELTVAAAYVIMGRDNPLDVLVDIAKGYNSARPLSADELVVVYPSTMMRVVVSLTMAAHTLKLHPENKYLLSTHEPGWKLLRTNLETRPEDVLEKLKSALA